MHTLIRIILWVGAALACAFPLHAQVSDAFKQLEEAAKTGRECVALLQTDKSQGSAVFLIEDTGTAYFATCCHVIVNADRVLLFNQNGEDITKGSKCTVYPYEDADIAIIKLVYDVKKTHGLKPLFANEEQMLNVNYITDGNGKFSMNGLLKDAVEIGWPGFGENLIATSTVSLLNIRPGKSLKASPDQYVVREGGPNADFLTTHGEINTPGMSGGLVIDNQKRFAGLIVGEVPMQGGLVIPARSVNTSFQDAKHRTDTPGLTNIKLPYSKAVEKHFNDWALKDALDLSRITDSWPALMDESTAMLHRFKEPKVSLIHFGNAGMQSKIKFNDCEPGAENNSGEVSLNLNGLPLVADPNEKSSYRLLLQPGENLLIVSSKLEKASGIRTLNDLVANGHKIEFSLEVNGHRQICISRTVPAIIHDYSIFVTLVCEGAPRQDPSALTINIPLKVVEDALKELADDPYSRFVWSDPHNTVFSSDFVFVGSRPVQLSVRSDRTLDALVHIELRNINAHLDALGMSLDTSQPKFDISMLNRIQFLSSTRCVISGRSISGTGMVPFAIPLGNGANGNGLSLSLELGGVVREALVSLVNQGLKSNTPMDVSNCLAGLLKFAPAELRSTLLTEPKSIWLRKEGTDPIKEPASVMMEFSGNAANPDAWQIRKGVFMTGAKLTLEELHLGAPMIKDCPRKACGKFNLVAKRIYQDTIFEAQEVNGSVQVSPHDIAGELKVLINLKTDGLIFKGSPKAPLNCHALNLTFLTNGELKENLADELRRCLIRPSN